MAAPSGLRRTGLSSSSPSLVAAASFNLREFSLTRSKLKRDPTPDNPLVKASSLENIDLIGGNGRWKQRAAVTEFERRRVVDIEETRLTRQMEETKQRRQAAKAEARKRVHDQEERRRLEVEERHEEEKRQKMRDRQQKLEKERARKQEEEAERQRRAPKTCESCSGSGTCQPCTGEGYLYSMYLVSKVTDEARQSYGKNMQGCTDCGGCKQGIRGSLQKGSGKCRPCAGYGKIWPNIEDLNSSSPKARAWVDRGESYDRLRVIV